MNDQEADQIQLTVPSRPALWLVTMHEAAQVIRRSGSSVPEEEASSSDVVIALQPGRGTTRLKANELVPYFGDLVDSLWQARPKNWPDEGHAERLLFAERFRILLSHMNVPCEIVLQRYEKLTRYHQIWNTLKKMA